MYIQVWARSDIVYIVGKLDWYSNNHGQVHWKDVKRVMLYLQRTKDFILTYWRSSHLEVIEYSHIDFAGYLDSKRLH